MIHTPRNRKRVPVLTLATLLTLGSMGGIATAAAKPVPQTPSVDPCNGRLAIQVATNGTFNLGAFPDPSTCAATADSWALTFVWPSSPGTSFTTVRVDGQDEVYGNGTQIQAPTDVNATTNSSAVQHGDIVVTQNLSIVTNPQTGQADAARIAYTVRNDGATSHAVGIRAMLDTDINSNDGAPFRVPGIGAVTTETDLGGANVPDSFQVFQDVTDPDHVAAGTLSGSGAVTPDRFVIANWAGIVNTLWDYTTDPQTVITNDSAYATYWNPQPLGAGQERTYVTYFGLGDISVSPGGPIQAAVSGPAALSCTGDAYQPNPFDIVATVHANAPVFAATAQLNLPPQLSLASGTALVQLGNMAAGDETQVTWSVLAAPQASDTVVEYSVSVAGGDQAPSQVTRTMELPGCTGGGNTAPVAQDQDVSTTQDTPIDVTLVATDADADPLTYAVLDGPSNGALSGDAPDLTYTPDAGYTGPDAFTFLANDGTVDSNAATVSINVVEAGGSIVQEVDPGVGAVIELPGTLGTSGRMILPAQPGGGDPITVTMSLFGTPGEVDATCDGNPCIGQGIEWALSDPSAFKRIKVVFFEDPSLVDGFDVETAPLYKDGVPIDRCGYFGGTAVRMTSTGNHPRQSLPCVYKRKVLKDGTWKVVLLATGEDPKGRI